MALHRFIFICFTVLLLATCLNGQVNRELKAIENDVFCTFPLAPKGVPISKPYTFKKTSQERQQNFNWTFEQVAAGDSLFGLKCATWDPNAETALTHAAEIWTDALDISQNIRVRACWCDDEKLPLGALGQAGSAYLLSAGAGAPIIQDVLYPVPMVEAIFGFEHTDASTVDIVALFNARRPDWYFGEDETMLGSQIDFISVAVHELGHGLGFAGSARYEDNDTDNGSECNGSLNDGCFAFSFPTIFDLFIDTDIGNSILDLTSPSAALGNALTSNGLLFDDTNSDFHHQRLAPIDIHSPSTFVSGSSYSHFSESTLPGELMSPSIAPGQAIRDPEMALDVMLEMGWSQAIVPVKLISFNAALRKNEVLLDWSTASEINNDFFSIERSSDNIDFHPIGKVQGYGNSTSTIDYDFRDRNPSFGKNYYRLKQIDFNGDYEYSQVRVIDHSESSEALSILPNPASNVLNVHVGQASPKDAALSIFASNGMLLKTSILAADHTEVSINIEDLASGNYYLRLVNGHNVVTKNFIVMQ